MKWICADFETSNSDINIKKEYTRVWAWDIYDHEIKKHTTGIDIETFIDTLFLYKSCIIYFHNLKFDGNFILNYLLKNNFKIDNSRRSGTISTLITDRLIWYSFTVYYFGRRYIFRDSAKKIIGSLADAANAFDLPIKKGEIDYKLHRDEGYIPTEEELDYIHNDTEIMSDILEYYYDNDMPSLTNASDALKTYKKIIGEQVYKYYFPILPKNIDDFIRKSYKGGFCYVNPKFKNKDLGNIWTYDVKSMYPSRMRYCKLPFGVPKYYRGKYEKDEEMPLYIQHIRVECRLKENHIPTIQIKSYLSIKLNYLENTNGEMYELYLTNIDLAHLLKDYRIFDIEYIDGFKFYARNDLFEDYIDKFYALKEHAKGAKKQLYKIFLNSLYGKFAMMTERSQGIPYIKDNHIAFEKTESEEVDAVYTAVASFITAYARDHLLKGIYANLENFVYCDTDSIHLVKPAKGIKIGKELGDFDLENGKIENNEHITNITKGRYLGQKCYILIGYNGKEYILKKIAGAPTKVKEQINWDNFQINFTSDANMFPKFRMKNVEGGVLLIPTEFTIKPK